MQLQLKQELQKLTKLGVNQLVMTKTKNCSLRICLDPHEPNEALMQKHYTIPILEDMCHEMKDAKIFTKADLSLGYWHIKLDEASSDLTTFKTCFGHFCW